mmetsp:Transcript_1596/g.5445  ORF Transcript_1596/g.5445 Transcript_1596/m.5445 type:complete len:216 (-) Transcript_1596:327-974(-)
MHGGGSQGEWVRVQGKVHHRQRLGPERHARWRRELAALPEGCAVQGGLRGADRAARGGPQGRRLRLPFFPRQVRGHPCGHARVEAREGALQAGAAGEEEPDAKADGLGGAGADRQVRPARRVGAQRALPVRARPAQEAAAGGAADPDQEEEDEEGGEEGGGGEQGRGGQEKARLIRFFPRNLTTVCGCRPTSEAMLRAANPANRAHFLASNSSGV